MISCDNIHGCQSVYGSLRVVTKSVANSMKLLPQHPAAAHPRPVVVSPGRSPTYTLSACETGTLATASILLRTLVFVQGNISVCVCMCVCVKY